MKKQNIYKNRKREKKREGNLYYSSLPLIYGAAFTLGREGWTQPNTSNLVEIY